MATPRKPEKPAPAGRGFTHLARLLRGESPFGALLVLLAVMAGGSYALWLHVRDEVLSASDYQLTADEIDISPPPPWIRADVKREALRGASLDEPLSLLEGDLAERVAKAFALHPWVAGVERVVKRHPARLRVELSYRRPVCMVELPGGGLYPVDALGTVLPSGDFTPLEARDYPRLAGVTSVPVGPVGTSWGDPRVAGGAAIAAAIYDSWLLLRLEKIVPASAQAPDGSTDNEVYELFTLHGTRIVWGRAASPPQGSEPTPVQKVTLLKQIVERHGSLDSPRAPSPIDLRSYGAAQATARLPGPAPR